LEEVLLHAAIVLLGEEVIVDLLHVEVAVVPLHEENPIDQVGNLLSEPMKEKSDIVLVYLLEMFRIIYSSGIFFMCSNAVDRWEVLS